MFETKFRYQYLRPFDILIRIKGKFKPIEIRNFLTKKKPEIILHIDRPLIFHDKDLIVISIEGKQYTWKDILNIHLEQLDDSKVSPSLAKRFSVFSREHKWRWTNYSKSDNITLFTEIIELGTSTIV